jgi:hypothetical protein
VQELQREKWKEKNARNWEQEGEGRKEMARRRVTEKEKKRRGVYIYGRNYFKEESARREVQGEREGEEKDFLPFASGVWRCFDIFGMLCNLL